MVTRILLVDDRSRGLVDRTAIALLEADQRPGGLLTTSSVELREGRDSLSLSLSLSLSDESLARVIGISRVRPIEIWIVVHHLELPWLIGRLASLDVLANAGMAMRGDGFSVGRGSSDRIRLVVATLETEDSLLELLWPDQSSVRSPDSAQQVAASRVCAALNIVLGMRGNVGVKAVASTLGVSRRHLDAQFRWLVLPTLASLVRAVRRDLARGL
ncbi:MAG: hypothetical protein ACT4OZ_12690, partial [Gemmatimonadota bacterium]